MRAENVANVLLVDDDPENLSSLQVALESDGHHVSVAGAASQAIEMLRNEPIEIIVTDYEMPGMDGAEFCRQVRARPAHHDLPIVMLSAAPEPVCAGRCWTLFLRKPARFDHLMAAIDTQIAGRRIREQREVRRLTLRVRLKCQPLAFSRWPALKAGCWP